MPEGRMNICRMQSTITEEGGTVMNMIPLTCSRCNATLLVEKSRGCTVLACPYCGSTMNALMDSDRVRIAEIRADTDRLGMAYSYKKHRDHLAMDWVMENTRVILIAAAVVLVLILIGVSSFRSRDNVRVPFSARDLNGKAYQDARTMFRDAGFSDIEVIARYDLWDGFLHNDQGNVGKVAQVTINGEERFGKNASYNKGSKVRIWYHCYP